MGNRIGHCPRCKKESYHDGKRSGRDRFCPPCFKLHRKTREQRQREKNAVRPESYYRELRKKCSQCEEVKSGDLFYKSGNMLDGLASLCRDCQKKYRKRNRARSDSERDTSRKRYLAKKYGITYEDYDNIFSAQNGLCKICLKSSEKMLVIDHDHDTGKVRGLLCSKCNVGLGCFMDDRVAMRRAILYLEAAQNNSLPERLCAV